MNEEMKACIYCAYFYDYTMVTSVAVPEFWHCTNSKYLIFDLVCGKLSLDARKCRKDKNKCGKTGKGFEPIKKSRNLKEWFQNIWRN